MKKIITLFLLLICSRNYSQEIEQINKTLLKLEASRKLEYFSEKQNSIINDSLLIHNEIDIYWNSIKELKKSCTLMGNMPLKELVAIFGEDGDDLFNSPYLLKKTWDSKSFGNLKIKLVTKNASFSPYTNPIYFSTPLLRKDHKYALIRTTNESDGGQMSIYKKENDTWVFYKEITLFYI